MLKLCFTIAIILLTLHCGPGLARREQNRNGQEPNPTVTTGKPSSNKEELSKQEAVQIAEEFIVQNGYTDLPPIGDKSKLSYETIEVSSDVDEVLRYRHHTLERNAHGAIRRGKSEPGWIVVFRYDPSYKYYSPEAGRAVTMDLDGSNLRMQHIEISLDSVEKVTK